MNFQSSKCKGNYLHKFVSIRASDNAVEERCVKAGCGVKHIIKLVNGQPRITEYARFHQREFLVPQHKLFNLEFKKIKKTRYA